MFGDGIRQRHTSGATTTMESAIPAPNAAFDLEVQGLAEIGHRRLNSAKPGSFFGWRLFW
jgi:hypothetical protein